MVQTTENYDDSTFQLQYYHDTSVKESEREFYFDDGKTANPIENQVFQILEFEAEVKGNWLKIDFEAKTGNNYKAETKTIALTIHNIKNKPKKIKIGKEKVEGKYNSKYKTLTLNVSWDTSTEEEIKIKLDR